MRTPLFMVSRYSFLFFVAALLLTTSFGQSSKSGEAAQSSKTTSSTESKKPNLEQSAKDTQTKTPKVEKMNGWVSDEKCGTKDIQNADCAKKCSEAGSKLVFVAEKDKRIIDVDNQDALKGHEGHHVSVSGKLDNGTLHIDKVAMLAQKCDPQACDRKMACTKAKEDPSGRCQSACRCS
jgi:hypothetical protein